MAYITSFHTQQMLLSHIRPNKPMDRDLKTRFAAFPARHRRR